MENSARGAFYVVVLILQARSTTFPFFVQIVRWILTLDSMFLLRSVLFYKEMAKVLELQKKIEEI